MFSCLDDVQRIIAIPIFGVLRFVLLIIDMLAAAFFGTCSRGCDVLPLSGCEGMLGFIAALNLFSIGALVLVILIRWFAEERAFSEALHVTSLLVLIDIALKASTMGTPAMLTVSCFPDSFPPFNTSMSMVNCPQPTCPVGDLFAMYSLYACIKALVGAIDLVLNTETLRHKPQDWYRLRGTHAK